MPNEFHGYQKGNTPKGVRTSERVIDYDRPCASCGYNLRGLMTGGTCPECGAPIRITRPAGDRLGEAPMHYILWLRTGFLALAIAFPGLLPLLLPTGIGGMAVAGVGLVCWCVGLTIVLMPRARSNNQDSLEETRRWNVLRLVVIAAQVPLPIAIGLGVVYGNSNLAIAAAEVLVGVWLAGFVPLGFYLSLLAQWAEDDSLTNRWRGGGWSVGGAGLFAMVLGLLNVVPTPSGFILSGLIQFLMVIGILIGWFMSLVAMAGLIWLMVLSIQSAVMVNWAKRNILDERDREQRRVERWRREAEEGVRPAEIANPNAVEGRRGGNIGAPAIAAGVGPASTLDDLPRVHTERPESPLTPIQSAQTATEPAAGAARARPDHPDRVPPPVDMGSDRPDLDPYELSEDS